MQVTGWRFERDEIAVENGIVAAKHPLAVEAGVKVLEQGGNAVDAAVATAFAVGVVEPYMSGIGGGGYLTVHRAGRDEDAVIDYFFRAPQGATPDMYELTPEYRRDQVGFAGVKDEANSIGYRSVAVPGTVAGLALALERYGTISLKEALEPAIRLAGEGFAVSWHVTLMIADSMGLITRFPASSQVFLKPGGLPPVATGSAGPDRLVQEDLARTLQRIADGGPAAFYGGETARALAADMARHGGLLSEQDLAAYRPRVLSPLVSGYRGYTLLALPGPTGGPTNLETLNILEGFDLARAGHNSTAALHLIAEASRLAFADRYQYLADPERIDVPWEGLVARDYARERRAGLDLQRAAADVAAGDPWKHQARRPSLSRPAVSTSAPPGGCTTHLSVVDRQRNAVSLTQTLVHLFGSGVTVPGTGIVLNNAMTLLDPQPGAANSIEPGKTPLSSMAHAIVLQDGQMRLVVGAPGGRRIPGTVLQVMLNVLDFDLGIQAACSAPLIDGSGPEIEISTRMSAEVREALAAMGHRLKLVEQGIAPRGFASPTGILRHPRTGRLHGGADPYYAGVAGGY